MKNEVAKGSRSYMYSYRTYLECDSLPPLRILLETFTIISAKDFTVHFNIAAFWGNLIVDEATTVHSKATLDALHLAYNFVGFLCLRRADKFGI